jgi:hypothetical protein
VNKRAFTTFAFVICIALIGGCATEGMSIPIGMQRTFVPTNPDSVLILLGPPRQTHEIIALVEGVASTDDYLSERRTQDAAIKTMKKEAARLGATAIVLTAKGQEPYAQMSVASTTGTAYANAAGDSAMGSAYYTTVRTTMGWQKMRVAGTAVWFRSIPDTAEK